MELSEIEGLTPEQLADVQKLVQSREDRIRTDYSKRLKDANDELARYKPKEKSEEEKVFEERISLLESREKEIAEKERAMQIADKLKEKGIPAEFAQYLKIGEDMEKDIESIGAAFGGLFLSNGNKPGNHVVNQGITKDDFKRMNYPERAKLFQEDNRLYKILCK